MGPVQPRMCVRQVFLDTVVYLWSSEAATGKTKKFQCETEKSADFEERPPKWQVLGSGGSENESIQKISMRGASTIIT